MVGPLSAETRKDSELVRAFRSGSDGFCFGAVRFELPLWVPACNLEFLEFIGKRCDDILAAVVSAAPAETSPPQCIDTAIDMSRRDHR